jgi:hypothetical protein
LHAIAIIESAVKSVIARRVGAGLYLHKIAKNGRAFITSLISFKIAVAHCNQTPINIHGATLTRSRIVHELGCLYHQFSFTKDSTSIISLVILKKSILENDHGIRIGAYSTSAIAASVGVVFKDTAERREERILFHENSRLGGSLNRYGFQNQLPRDVEACCITINGTGIR